MRVIPGRPEDLPDFRKPPLTETVLSLQFEPIHGLTTAHLGLLWHRFREQFPLVEEHPPLRPVFEKFDAPSAAQVEVTVEEKLPVPRVWFINREKTQLIQVQPDRFIHNWRKMEGIEPYPRYEPIRDRFRSEVGTFEEFLRTESLAAPVINQCEVMYINHVEPSGIWQRHGQMDKVLAIWSRTAEERFLPEVEDGGLQLRFVISRGADRVGRLTVVLQPAWKKADNTPIILLSLTARGKPLGEGMDGAFDFFQLGRKWIVKGFADLTSPEMQSVWERVHG